MDGMFASKLVTGAALVASSFLPTGKAAAQALDVPAAPATLEQSAPAKTPVQERIDAALGALDAQHKDVYVPLTLRARVADGVVSGWDITVLDAMVDTEKQRHGRKHPQVQALRALKGTLEEIKDAQESRVTRDEDAKDKPAARADVREQQKIQAGHAAMRDLQRRLEWRFYFESQGFFR